MKPIDIFEKQYAEARALQLRFAEKEMQSALLGVNQAAAQARAIFDVAHFDHENHKESKFCLAIENLGLFEKAFNLKAKTAAAAKVEANKILLGMQNYSGAVIFFECNAVLRKETKWSDVK